MTKVLGIAALVAVLSCAGGAFADIIADGNLSDWGVTPGSDWQNNVSASQWLEPEVGSQGYVGPGWGGQPFNVEAMYLKLDPTYLYYAVVTGFPNSGVNYNSTNYYPGDVLFDFEPLYNPSSSTTATGAMDFAVETTSYGSQFTHGGMTSQNQGAGSFYSDVSLALATDKWDGVYYPVEIKRSGSNNLATATLVGQTDFAYNDDDYGSNHWVIEGRLPLAFLGGVTVDSFQVWWTMTCANDYAHLCDELPLGQVPEPGTVLLTGSGILFGIGCYIRRRMK